MTVLDQIIFGLEVAVIGMVIVFIGLFLIIALVKILSWILKDRPKKKEQEIKKETVTAPAEPVAAQQNDTELVAVLAAAVAAATGSESGFRIRSFRKVGQSAWAKAGRNEQIYNKL